MNVENADDANELVVFKWRNSNVLLNLSQKRLQCFETALINAKWIMLKTYVEAWNRRNTKLIWNANWES